MCLGFGYIPDIGPMPFQIIRQKLFQRCETHIEAQSCKASLEQILANIAIRPNQFSREQELKLSGNLTSSFAVIQADNEDLSWFGKPPR